MGKMVSLQALRGLAFLGIFLIHARSPIQWAALGVSVFFVMSGFLMMFLHSDADNNTTIQKAIRFSIIRIKKIYKLHIITMLFAIISSVALMIPHGLSIRATLGLFVKIILNITLLQTWIPYVSINSSLNGVAWFLSVTMFLYFCFPYICGWIKKKSNLATICILIIILEIISCRLWLQFVDSMNETYIWFMYYFPIFRIGDFFLGCCIGHFYKEHGFRKLSVIKGTILELGALTLSVVIYVFPHDGNNLWLNAIYNWTTLYMILATIWVYLFVCNSGLFTRVMTNSLLIFIGNISAYTYLIHFVITKYTNELLSYFRYEMSGLSMVLIISGELILTITAALVYLRLLKRSLIERNNNCEQKSGI